MKDRISARLKDLRTQAQYTLKQVADKLGVKIGRYQHYEKGRAIPPIDIMIQLGQVYHLTLDQLIGNEPPKEGDFESRYRSLPVERRKIVDLMLSEEAK